MWSICKGPGSPNFMRTWFKLLLWSQKDPLEWTPKVNEKSMPDRVGAAVIYLENSIHGLFKGLGLKAYGYAN